MRLTIEHSCSNLLMKYKPHTRDVTIHLALKGANMTEGVEGVSFGSLGGGL